MDAISIIESAAAVNSHCTEARRHGVVHRDRKPANIMIDRNGLVRIMDFGIARSIGAKGPTGVGVMISLGKIAETQGDKARARLNYQRFLDLMKDADPGLSVVEEAKKRLAGLGS
jgi:serine/threonine protein kinase